MHTLSPAQPGTSAFGYMIGCAGCKCRSQYGHAAANGWTYDPAAAFGTYYCTPCTSQRVQPQQMQAVS